MEMLTVGTYGMHSGCNPVHRPLLASAGDTLSSKRNSSASFSSLSQVPLSAQGATGPIAVERAQCCRVEKNPPELDTDRRHFLTLAALSLGVFAEAPAQAARDRRPTNILEDAYKVTSKFAIS